MRLLSGHRKRRLFKTAAALLTALLCFVLSCASNIQQESVDETLLAWINAEASADAGQKAAIIRSLDESRIEASIQESVSIYESISEEESRSIEESVKESMAALESEEASRQESLSIEESSRQESLSIEEASIQESLSVEASIRAEEEAAASYAAVISSVAESIASGGTPQGQMQRGKIVTVGDEAVPLIRQLFSDVVVLGNSRAKSVLDSGVLTENTVLYKWAAHMDEISDMVQQAASLQRKKALFIMGVNDLGYYMDNESAWKRDYLAMIALFRSINPNAQIYLQEIIPIKEAYRYRWHNMDRVVRYNEILREICAEAGCTYVTASDFAFDAFLNDDTGAHYDRRFHLYWAQTIANQMHLWEDHGL